MSESPQTNPSERFSQILIDSPLQDTISMRDISFNEAQNKILSYVTQMYKSKFYQSIKIHYGVKQRNEVDSKTQIFKRKQEILQYKIQEEQQYVSKLKMVRDQTDIQELQKSYKKNISLIKERQGNMSKFDFVPWIYIQAKKKHPLYGKIVQEFDKKGWAVLRATTGFRAPLLQFDKIQLNVESPSLNYIGKRRHYLAGLNWEMPIQLQKKNIFVNTQISCSPIFQNIDDKKYSVQMGMVDSKSKYQLYYGQRFPRFYGDLVNFAKNNYYEPSKKFSFKVDRTIQDSIVRGQIQTGKFQQIKAEVAIPFLSHSSFLKLEYNRKRLYDLFSFSSQIQNPKLKELLRYSNIETNFNCQTYFAKKSYVSDLLQNPQVRGFQNDKNPNSTCCALRSSLKFNVFNYPAIGAVGLVPFLYTHAGLIFEKQKIFKPFLFGSSGIGVSYALAKSIKLQLLYPFFQAQNQRKRQMSTLQFRISVND